MTKTILVIEDDGAVAGLLEDVLSAEGFTVLVERDGEWGLRTFEERSPDLVLMDVLLPKIQGFDLIPRLRALPNGKDVPLLVMSGVYRSATYQAQMSARYGVKTYFDKPLDIDVLLDVLHDVFSSAYPEPQPGRNRLPSSLTKGASAAAKAPAMPTQIDVPTKGTVDVMPFARLLGLCFQARVTGALMLRRTSVKKILYFKEGMPVFIRSNLLDECLGRVMINERLITQKECERSLETRRKDPSRRQGEILVDMGSISQHNLEFALELQIQEKLFEIFSWQEGTFQLNPQADYTGPQVALSMSPAAMVHEGALRAMSTERIRKDLLSLGDRPLMPSSDPTFRYQALQLDPRTDRLLDLMDGSRNAETLLDSGAMEAHDAAPVIYALVCAGLLHAAGPPPAIPIPITEDDLEVLGTHEIDAVGALEQVAPELAKQHPAQAEAAGKALARALVDATRGASAIASAMPLPEAQDETEQDLDAQDDFDIESELPIDIDAEGAADSQDALPDEGETLPPALAMTTIPGPALEDPMASAAQLASAPEADLAEVLAKDSHKPEPEVEDEARPEPVAAQPEVPTQATREPEPQAEAEGESEGEAAPEAIAKPEIDVTSAPEAEPLAELPAASDDDHDPEIEVGGETGSEATAEPAATAEPGAQPSEHSARTYVPGDVPPPQGPPPPQPAPPPSDPALLTPGFSPSKLPRASTWTKNPSAAGIEKPAAPVGLSEELRQQVRARLEAQSARLSTQRPAPEPKAPRRLTRTQGRRGLGLDLDKERARIETELRTTIETLQEQDLYRRLELDAQADEDEIFRAYERLSRRLHPDRVTAGLGSPELRMLAEERLLLVRRAYQTLQNPAARARYNTQLGLERLPEDAPLVVAEQAFFSGLEASQQENWSQAQQAFAEALRRDPQEGSYASYLAWATFALAPEDEAARERALDLLRQAAELNPRHEEVYLYAGRIQRQIGRPEAALQAYQRALRCNPDCVEALGAVRDLEPKETRKGGFLSRLAGR